MQTDGAAGIAQHSRRCTDDSDGDATAKRTHGQQCCGPMRRHKQQPCCLEKMHVVLRDGVDEVDADAGVECARSTGGRRLNPDQ